MKKNFVVRILCLTVALLLGSVSSVFAEDSYRQLLEKANETAGGLVQKKEKFVDAFSKIAVKEGCSMEEARQLTAEYYDEVFLNEAYEWVESIYKPLVSEGDLQNMVAFFSSPKGKLAKEHGDAYDSEASQQQMMARMYPDLAKLAVGEKVGKISSSAPKSYQKLFHEYYKTSGVEKSMDGIVRQIIAVASQNDNKLTKSLSSYFSDNIEVLVMDCGYPTVTEEDLTALVEYFKSDSGKKISAANASALDGAVKFAVSSAMKFQMNVKEKLKQQAASQEVETAE